MINFEDINSEDLVEFRDNSDQPTTEPRLYQNRPIAPVATPPPMVSSLHAQLRTDLWQQYPSGVGYFQHQAKGNSSNFIEHYITSPGDITLLPLDEALQIINKFGLITAKLHLIFSAHTMRQEEPWKNLFTIKGSDLIKEMGWDKRTDLPVFQKLNEVAKTLNKAGYFAKEALYQFGYLAQDILKIDPYHDELALRLALHLTMESRFHTSGTYKVQTLLEALLPQTIIDAARSERRKAHTLTNSWNHALEVLLGLERAFQIEFDAETYPEWLRPNSSGRKARGYFDKLLAAKITIHPPAPIPTLLATKIEPKQIQPRLNAAPKPKLTSNHIRKARAAKGWSQAQLAGWLGVSQYYISMLERGKRIPTPELEAKIWQLLSIPE